MLQEIRLPPEIDDIEIPKRIEQWVADSMSRIEAFQDRWLKTKIEQFVAADYRLVYQTLRWIKDQELLIGRAFLEWGSGFAVVSCLATELGFDAVGIESEHDLLLQGIKTIDHSGAPVQLVQGNFLPPGAEALAPDTTLPSLGHGGPNGYDEVDMEIDDFAVIYSYPWPGEGVFHESVFERFAAIGAVLVMFCGPYEMRMLRKVK